MFMPFYPLDHITLSIEKPRGRHIISLIKKYKNNITKNNEFSLMFLLSKWLSFLNFILMNLIIYNFIYKYYLYTIYAIL